MYIYIPAIRNEGQAFIKVPPRDYGGTLMRRSNIDKKMPNIIAELTSRPTRVFSRNDLKNILTENRTRWDLPSSLSVDKFINYMTKNTKLITHTLDFPYMTTNRYTYGKITEYEVVQSIKENSYFTHHTAMYMHELTDVEPDTIYLNIEQTKHLNKGNKLEQSRIDNAFFRNVRISTNRAQYGGKTVCLLNGMYTGKLGVVKKSVDGKRVSVTNIERTLVDIAVRPIYSGGSTSVLSAYSNAHKHLSTEKLFETLKKLCYVYPYHQAIGFYLDRSGAYQKKDVDIFKTPGLQHNFYLTHNMEASKFSAEWRLHYPADL